MRAQSNPEVLERNFQGVLTYIRDQGIEPEKPLSHMSILHALQDHHKLERIGLTLGQAMTALCMIKKQPNSYRMKSVFTLHIDNWRQHKCAMPADVALLRIRELVDGHDHSEAEVEQVARRREKQIKRAMLRGEKKAIKAVASDDFLRSYDWRKTRYAALLKNNGLCELCGRGKPHGLVLHVDHIKPRRTHPELAFNRREPSSALRRV